MKLVDAKRASDKNAQLSVKEQKARKRQAKKERKAKMDPNKPKRPPTAFFIYLEEFRKAFKEEHPDVKGVAVVGKACGDKWKEMTDDEKAPYVAKANQKREEYEKALSSYNQKQTVGGRNGLKDAEDIEDDDGGSEEDDDDGEEE
ncbi:hypothetical protein KP509_03G049000 [Ceratopteris richardii]|uniref:HMG box domain-containing protein n=1 Tax=Ceratopteris richardii TaxID=49495 RepID=A0A8T2V6P4_CERRI|nr:hypothetical protein KP509_03G049000 [Ceratopteris richardii]